MAKKQPRQFAMPAARPEVKRPDDCPVRKSDWAVDTDGRVGIVAGLHVNDHRTLVADFHVTDKDGQTTLVADVPAYSLRRAFLDEVPAKRRSHLTDAEVIALGFVKRT